MEKLNRPFSTHQTELEEAHSTKMNSLRSKLQGIKNSEYRIQESGEKPVSPHFYFPVISSGCRILAPGFLRTNDRPVRVRSVATTAAE
jgi:hypothetical protein